MDVLLVDDDELVRDAYKDLLSKLGHRVVTTDGVGAILALRRDVWDVLIADILMPDTDGIEVIRAAAALAAPPHIIAISGGGKIAAHQCLALARALGADEGLVKPVTAEALGEALQRAR